MEYLGINFELQRCNGVPRISIANVIANASIDNAIRAAKDIARYEWKNISIQQRILEIAMEFHFPSDASDLGVGFLERILSFNCLKWYVLTLDEIGEIVFGQNYDHDCASLVIDALCWAVLEDLAFRYDQ